MSGLYLLDTNVVSDLLRRKEPVCTRAAAVPLSSLIISSFTAGELHFGLAKRPNATSLATLVLGFLRYVDVRPWNEAVAPHYGALRARLELAGASLAPLDLMIAAHALALDATLVTADKAMLSTGVVKAEDWSVEVG